MAFEERFPGLMHANETVVLAERQEGLQTPLTTRAHDCDALDITFSEIKTDVIIFPDSTAEVLTIQGHEIPRVREYRYSAVWVNERLIYMGKLEQTIRTKRRSHAAIMKH